MVLLFQSMYFLHILKYGGPYYEYVIDRRHQNVPFLCICVFTKVYLLLNLFIFITSFGLADLISIPVRDRQIGGVDNIYAYLHCIIFNTVHILEIIKA